MGAQPVHDPRHEPRPPRRELTLDAWYAMDDEEPGELVDGELAEEEVPSAIHELIVMWLGEALRRWLGGAGVVLGSEAKYAVTARRGRKPDVAVYLPGGDFPPRRGVIRVPPAIVVEIVSPTPRDHRRDRVEKLHDYAAFGVRWYWLLDPDARTLEILELDPQGRYVHVLDGTDDVVRGVPGCDGLELDLPGLWAEIDRLPADEEG